MKLMNRTMRAVLLGAVIATVAHTACAQMVQFKSGETLTADALNHNFQTLEQHIDGHGNGYISFGQHANVVPNVDVRMAADGSVTVTVSSTRCDAGGLTQSVEVVNPVTTPPSWKPIAW